MKKIFMTIMVLLALVLTSASVLAGSVMGPYWYDCNAVSPWQSYDFATCSKDDSTWSTHIIMDAGDTKTVGLGVLDLLPQNNPYTVQMRYANSMTPNDWQTFYTASVDTLSYMENGVYVAPFVADTISFSEGGIYNVQVLVTPQGQSTHVYPMLATVNEENDCPSIVSIADQVADEGDLVQFDIVVNDNNDDPGVTHSSLPSGSSVHNINPTTWRFTWMTDFASAGVYPITFDTNDGLCGDSEQLTITIHNVDQQASWSPGIPDMHTPEDVNPPVFNSVDLDIYASDYDDSLVYAITNETNTDLIDCYLWGQRNQYFACEDPAANQSGTSGITVTANGVPDSFTVYVDEVPDAPVLDHIENIVVHEGEAAVITATAQDIDSPILNYFIDNPDFVQVVNVFTWYTQVGDAGIYIVNVTVQDQTLLTDVQSVQVTVLPALVTNNPPVADFIWTPQHPVAGQSVLFDASPSSDPDNDVLTYSWDFNDDNVQDAVGLNPTYSWNTPGNYPVALTVSDGQFTDSITKIVEVSVPGLEITKVACDDPVLVNTMQSCTVRAEHQGVPMSAVNVNLFYQGSDAFIGNCMTAPNGECTVQYPANNVGVYVVYATATKLGYTPDDDHSPTNSYTVVDALHTVTDLEVYNDNAFTQVDYAFYRGNDIYVKFRVYDEDGNLTNTASVSGAVSAFSLHSGPGGVLNFSEVMDLNDGWYYYGATIPPTHGYIGNTQTFEFEFTNLETSQRVVAVTILNNPPVISHAVANEFTAPFSTVTQVDLTAYGSDVEDSGADLVWTATGFNPNAYTISIDAVTDIMTITPVNGGSYTVTLWLHDLDGAFDNFDVQISVGGSECSDGIDNDGDLLVDMDDPGCVSPSDNDESNQVLTQCSDGLDNDGDGLIDMNDPGCANPLDDDETDVVVYQCSDGIDNDNDGWIDLQDPGCTSPVDDDEADVYQCSDLADNDLDGLVDMADPDCASPTDDDESGPGIAQCQDDVDNDGDGFIDFNGHLIPGVVDTLQENESALYLIGGYAFQVDVLAISGSATTITIDGDTFTASSGQTVFGSNFRAHVTVIVNQVVLQLDRYYPPDPECDSFVDNDESPGQNQSNIPPVAVLNTTPTAGMEDLLVTVNGSLSYDVDGIIVTYSYDYGDSMSTGTLFGQPLAFNHLYTNPGIYVVTLTVTDDDGASDNASVNITVLPDNSMTQCSDGIDNDVDGLIDMNDPGCSNPLDDDEIDGISYQCSDGIDNDGDLLIDMNDPGCTAPTDNNETDSAALPQCSDGLDNDGDGLIDMADPDCSNPGDESESSLPQCSDGLDNDNDGYVDLQDPDCVSAQDNSEGGAPIYQCSDGVDNDGDTYIDLADPDCSSATDDSEGGAPTYQCSDGLDNDNDGYIDLQDTDCDSATDDSEGVPITVTQCSDGLDNDGDTYVDLQDPDCDDSLDDSEGPSAPTYECSDGLDNDGDTYVDLQDPGCDSATDDSEGNGSSVVYQCNDGFDNDGDGLVDMADPDCSDLTDDSESSTPQCSDGVDNDFDGKIDLQDTDCTSATDDSEYCVDCMTPLAGSWPPRPVMTDEFTVNRIDINSGHGELDLAHVGGELIVDVAVENGFDYDMKDIDIVVWVMELGLKKSYHFDVDSGKTQAVSVVFDVPFDAEPGYYDVLVEASGDDVRRAKYREFLLA